MSDFFESGYTVREPSWHRKEQLLADWPGSWAEARQAAGLTWDPVSQPLYDGAGRLVPDWQLIRRDDVRPDPDVPEAVGVLGVQPSTYAVVTNTQFGEIIEYVVALDEGERIRYDTALSIYGGRQVVATVLLEQPLQIDADPSKSYPMVAFVSRHDGQGGIRGIPTTIRVVCANTLRQAEQQGDVDKVGFTIRHTANWQTRLDAARDVIITARRDSQAWADLANRLAGYKAGPRQRDRFLERFLPQSSDMSDRQVEGVTEARAVIRSMLEQATTLEGIAGTGYGLVMAATEWSDHYRPHRSESSYVARQLLRAEPLKSRAVRVVKQMAGV